MADEDKKTGGGDGDTKVEAVTVEALQKQIENLNKGIAGYRDTAAQAKAEKVKAAIDKAAKDEDEDDPEVKLDPKDIKKLEAWAKQQGFVTQEEMTAERTRLMSENLLNIETQAVEEFLKTHPELNKDEEWAKVKEQFALYKQPTSLTGYRQLLTRIFKELFPKDDGASRARAEIKNRERLSLGGGSQKEGGSGDGDEIDKLMEKYPRLDRDQIVTRLKEINDLAEVRKNRKK